MKCLRQLEEKHSKFMEELAQSGIETAQRVGAFRCIAEDNEKPIGLVDFWEDEAFVEPHIDWHPKATKREKYRVFVAGMNDFLGFKSVILKVADSETPFFDMWVKRGALRKVGILEDVSIGNVKELHIYQLRRDYFVKNI